MDLSLWQRKSLLFLERTVAADNRGVPACRSAASRPRYDSWGIKSSFLVFSARSFSERCAAVCSLFQYLPVHSSLPATVAFTYFLSKPFVILSTPFALFQVGRLRQNCTVYHPRSFMTILPSFYHVYNVAEARI